MAQLDKASAYGAGDCGFKSRCELSFSFSFLIENKTNSNTYISLIISTQLLIQVSETLLALLGGDGSF